MSNKSIRPRGRPSSKADPVSQQAVLAAAFQVFMTQGYDSATIRQISSLAGVSTALLNHMFGTKEALWFEAVEAAYGPIHEQQMEVLRASLHPTDRAGAVDLSESMRGVLHSLLGKPGLLAFLYREGEQENRRAAFLRARYLRPIMDVLWEMYLHGSKKRQLGRIGFEALMLGAPRLLVFPILLIGEGTDVASSEMAHVADEVVDVLVASLFSIGG
ncbi:MAG: TetR/AcrR family transcriptional regulator [Gammaproteobacteria bacterium]|jgi:AcrR family transcriptional regulator|nr:TetR/AcrR family transcriptional regulator [Gammaproteobacteria bacterium]MBQ0775666.1 TetR/AcrR family transcriptional regulator [Gammaproteobacteria bacterium]MDF1781128.1 TetR/AcrR family transcriptional regulator [Alcanivoracaceae bacterium]|tara:strand:+ start:33551 stop:34198 length:648 start_codon:yes stop_codon:yes gene_type:complete